MAVGAVNKIESGVMGNKKFALVSVVGTSSYTTTGDALDLAQICGFTSIVAVFPGYGGGASSKTTAPSVVAPLWVYDIQSKKLQAFGTAAGATGLTEATAAGNFSAQTILLFVLGS